MVERGPITDEKDKLPRFLTCRGGASEAQERATGTGTRTRTRTRTRTHTGRTHRYTQVDRLQRERLHPVAVPRRLRAGCILPFLLLCTSTPLVSSALPSAPLASFSSPRSLLSSRSPVFSRTAPRLGRIPGCVHTPRVHFRYRQRLRYHHLVLTLSVAPPAVAASDLSKQSRRIVDPRA